MNSAKPLTAAAVMVMTIGCDHATKHIATAALVGSPDRSFLGDVVRLTYAENPGAFLSLGATLPTPVRVALLTVGTGLMLVVLGAFALRARRGWMGHLGLALLLAGGVSNWIDRAAHGHVVDFINIGIGPLRTGIFNVADVAILVGAAIVLISNLHQRPVDLEPEGAPP